MDYRANPGWGNAAMTLFEFTFGITALILGLALTHMAATAQKLAYAGRRVHWAPETVLLAGIVFLVIVQVWLDQWYARDRAEMTIGRMILTIFKMQTIYFGAASVLPEPSADDARFDMFAYYDRTRWLTYGSLIVGLTLFNIDWLLSTTKAIPWSVGLVAEIVLFPALYLSLILIRWRPYNIALLGGGLIYFAWSISGIRLTV